MTEEVSIFVRDNPDCSSVDISQEFGITVAKAFTLMNTLIESGLAFKTITRSKRNNKKILGYRMVPSFDVVVDNEDGSMRSGEVVALLKRSLRLGHTVEYVRFLVESHNEWRRMHGVREIQTSDVFGG